MLKKQEILKYINSRYEQFKSFELTMLKCAVDEDCAGYIAKRFHDIKKAGNKTAKVYIIEKDVDSDCCDVPWICRYSADLLNENDEFEGALEEIYPGCIILEMVNHYSVESNPELVKSIAKELLTLLRSMAFGIPDSVNLVADSVIKIEEEPPKYIENYRGLNFHIYIPTTVNPNSELT